MDFKKTKGHDPGDYLAFVAWLVDITAESLQAAKGDAVRVRAAVDDYLNRGYAANLTSGELTDFFCVDIRSILDRAGYDCADADEAVKLFDDLNSRSHNAFDSICKLGSNQRSGVYLKAPCNGETLMELESSARPAFGEKISAELIRFFAISDGCQINDAYFHKAKHLLEHLGRGTSGMVPFGEDGTAYFVIDHDDKRCHIILEGGDEKNKSFDSLEAMMLTVMKEQGVL